MQTDLTRLFDLIEAILGREARAVTLRTFRATGPSVMSIEKWPTRWQGNTAHCALIEDADRDRFADVIADQLQLTGNGAELSFLIRERIGDAAAQARVHAHMTAAGRSAWASYTAW